MRGNGAKRQNQRIEGLPVRNGGYTKRRTGTGRKNSRKGPAEVSALQLKGSVFGFERKEGDFSQLFLFLQFLQ